MVISFLNGGLGNQMFQYSLGRKLSLKHQTEFRTDLRWFSPEIKGMTARHYELHQFKVASQPATEEEVKKVTIPVSNTVLKKFFFKWQSALPYYKRSVVEEKHFHFDEKILLAGKQVYLSGYWQSEKYFQDIRNILLKDFTPKEPLTGENKELAERIRTTQSVSLHVRRADYVSNRKISEVHGVCPPEYYNSAINLISGKVSGAAFFVFSDDIAWCREHFRSKQSFHFIEHNKGADSFWDMWLMSLCRHNIIANSSFSWWAAWLNQNPGKIVIAPHHWFRDVSKDSKDLIPETWIKL